MACVVSTCSNNYQKFTAGDGAESIKLMSVSFPKDKKFDLSWFVEQVRSKRISSLLALQTGELKTGQYVQPGVSTFENDCGCPTYICGQGRCHEVLTRVDGLRCVKPTYPQILISTRISVTLF